MTDTPSRAEFRFEYDPAVIRYGTGAVDDLSAELDAQGFERALVVCGQTVGDTPAVMDPVLAGLGEKLAGVFAETTPDKRLSTAVDGVAAMDDHDADVLVALGGGSSLDVAKLVAVLAGGRDPEAAGRELAETGTVTITEPVAPIVTVPTTLAGAELSQVAGVTASPAGGLVEESVGGGVSDPRLMPRAVVYDPELFATTPEPVLCGSAMNGFDKGIETIYAANSTPVTDATAARGLGLLSDGLQALGERGAETEVLEPVVEGIALVQYGISRPDGTTLSLVHAFGHGLTSYSDIQQGVAHGVIAPHALRYLFTQVDGRRDLLAEALGVGDAADPAEAVVEQVADVRDALDLPASLDEAGGPDPDQFPGVAEAVVDDSFMANAPSGLDATVEEIEAVLHEAY